MNRRLRFHLFLRRKRMTLSDLLGPSSPDFLVSSKKMVKMPTHPLNIESYNEQLDCL